MYGYTPVQNIHRFTHSFWFYAGEPAGFMAALLQEKKPQKKSFLLSKDIILMMPSEVGVPIFLDFKQVEFVYSNRLKTEFNHADDGKLTLDLKKHYV